VSEAKTTACIVEDTISIKAPAARVFKALTEGDEIARWWPKAAQSDPKPGGKLVLTWFNDSKMESKFEKFVPNKEVAYPFYIEHLSFTLNEKDGATELLIRHECGQDAALHVSSAWGFLKANLKCYIEKGWDLRD
jgi:uncharacterized protein YndB with AHSA1/START domain